jgi:hypothetical protein
MKIIKNVFGYVDELETIEEFYSIHGRNVAESLDRVYNNNKFSKDWTKAALREGFTREQIEDFQTLQYL